MKFTAAIIGALSFAGANAAPLVARSEQVSLKSYKYENGILSGEANVQYMNCGRQNPRVQVFWAQGDKWQETAIEAGRNFQGPPGAYNTYTFQGKADSATQFFIKYTCYTKEFYDPGNFVNYQIKSTA
ncbi:hypothetical protein TWF694_008906 [Orbilia ellipsospora]|uniref:Uncharacterized protein n=1 Tax=Orbilia ellipsospora TaxID=2528407 RepID=A0AAV9XDP3_9PEZI